MNSNKNKKTQTPSKCTSLRDVQKKLARRGHKLSPTTVHNIAKKVLELAWKRRKRRARLTPPQIEKRDFFAEKYDPVRLELMSKKQRKYFFLGRLEST